MDRTELRVELDLPTVVIGKFGHVGMDNGASLESLLAHFFTPGEVVTLHVIAEVTGQVRKFCTFEIRPDNEAYSPHICGSLTDAHGVCYRQEDHAKQLQRELQPLLELGSGE